MAIDLGRVDAQSLHPIHKVVGFLKKLGTSIESRGLVEQNIYDTFACGVQEQLDDLVESITLGEKEMKRLSALILELSSEIGTNTAKVQNLEEDIREGDEAQKAADEMRKKENEDYVAEVEDKNSCIMALQAALNVFKNTGEGGGFLQQARVMSVVGGVRRVLANAAVVQTLSDADRSALQHFVQSPGDTPNLGSAAMSAVQVDQEQMPSSDYAPEKDRILGILETLLHTFKEDMEQLKDKEQYAVAEHQNMTEVRQRELTHQRTSLEDSAKLLADQKYEQSESKEARTQTKLELIEVKAAFEKLKIESRERSTNMSLRNEIRSHELQLIQEALAFFNSPAAQKVLQPHSGPQPGFLQIAVRSSSRSLQRSSSKSQQLTEMRRQRSYSQLKALARRFGSMQIAKIAVQLQATGHFDAVIQSCKKMLKMLRAEEKADIDHMDHCQSQEDANQNAMEDLNLTIHKQKLLQKDSGQTLDALMQEMEERKAMVKSIKKEMEELLEERNKERDQYLKSATYGNTIVSLRKSMKDIEMYYEKNKMALKFLQGYHGSPQSAYATGPTFDGLHQAKGIFSMMAMISQDAEKLLASSMEEEKKAQAEYQARRASMQKRLRIHNKMLAVLSKQMADADGEREAAAKEVSAKGRALKLQEDVKTSLGDQCGWWKTHFQPRKEKRQVEIQGLRQAIAYLSDAESV